MLQQQREPSPAITDADEPVGTAECAALGRVLVTGAAGFIGSHLIERLLAMGCQVSGLDRRSPHSDPIAAGNLAAMQAHPNLTLLTHELNAVDLGETVTGHDTVFHLAAIPGVRPSWGTRFPEYVATNILATQQLLAACETSGVQRLVFASSSSVYGPASQPSREYDPTVPISPYGVTKLAGEQLCLAHGKRPDTNLLVRALRYFTVYGPRQRPDMAIGRILFAALSGVSVDLFGDGTQQREFTYVADAVDATIAAAQLDVPVPVVINVGGGSSVSMLDVIRVASQVTERPVPLNPMPAMPGDVPSTAADLTFAQALLHYQPTVGLREGMARQAEWMRGLEPEQYRAFLPTKTHPTEVQR